MFGLFYPIFLNRGNSYCRLCFLSDAVLAFILITSFFSTGWKILKQGYTNYFALETKIQVFSLVFYNLPCAILSWLEVLMRLHHDVNKAVMVRSLCVSWEWSSTAHFSTTPSPPQTWQSPSVPSHHNHNQLNLILINTSFMHWIHSDPSSLREDLKRIACNSVAANNWTYSDGTPVESKVSDGALKLGAHYTNSWRNSWK